MAGADGAPMQRWSPCLAQCCKCKGLPQEGTSLCFSVCCDLTFLFVYLCAVLCSWCTLARVAIREQSQTSSSGRLCLSPLKQGLSPPLYPQHWGDRRAHRHARLFMWVPGIQTQLLILVNQGSLPTEPSLQLLLVFARGPQKR